MIDSYIYLKQRKNMLKAIIIDDEPFAIDALKDDIHQYLKSEVEVVSTCSNPLLAKDLILSHEPDIVFLDIQMPILNGFQLLNLFDKINFEIVFVTAFDEFAIKAFEFSAADYLLKPVDRNRLKNTINKIKNRKSSQNIDERLTVILHNLKLGTKEFPTIAVPLSDGIEFVPVEEIMYLKSDSNYCHIHLVNDKSIYVSKPLKHFTAMLEDFEFIRVHQSWAINVRFIRKYSKSDGGEIILTNEKRIPLSKMYKQNILDYIRS